MDGQPSEPAILPLDTEVATLDLVGGKGRNLSVLARAGFAVPPGFLITTRAYADFARANDLADFAPARAREARPDDPEALEAASAAIRERFAAGSVPDHLTRAVRDAYTALGEPPVAVRSSATAEDLPGMSFAGQHDTILNVVDADALLRAVVDCWSSLWTARAIGYRARMGVPSEAVSLAVAVQTLVSAEVSGVLFTANPLDGRRTELVIDAAFGLGEALVSGQLEPDHYAVARDGRILEKQLGSKALSVRPLAAGGTRTAEEHAADRQALPDAVIEQLARVGARVDELYGEPQDIEWAWDGDALWLLQARPITALFPPPEDLPAEPLHVLVSFGAVQGMLDPITPLGRDALRGLAVGAARRFGFEFTRATQPVLVTAGERLFIDLSRPLRHRLGRRAFRMVLPLVEPGTARAMEPLWDDPRLTTAAEASHAAFPRHVAPVALRILARVAFTLLWPDWSRARVQARIEALVAETRARADSTAGLRERVELLEGVLYRAFPFFILQLGPRLATGLGSLYALGRLAARLPGAPDVLLLTRGLPHNTTTEMDLELWRTAQVIRNDASAAGHFKSAGAEELASAWLAGELPGTAQTAIAGFLERYGMRGVGEIDLGRPRWREDPTPIMQVLQSYLSIDDPKLAPDAVFARSAREAEATVERLAARFRASRGGLPTSHLARWTARRVRALAGLRESPKFLGMRLLGIARACLLESGRELAAAGVLLEADDLFYLDIEELLALADGEARDWQGLVAERRERLRREQRRRQIPRLLLSDGQAFYEGIEPARTGAGDLVGSPVSPGRVEGVVRVVRDPRSARLQPGEILVCPATDPGWTPLFLVAGGLVMEVGGLMTHGAVVAREYGIPAVVGVHEATERLRSGQRIRLDGGSGRIELLGEAPDQSDRLTTPRASSSSAT